MGLFGKTQQASPKEMVNEWTHRLRKEGNNIERQIRGIQREEEKTKRMIKDSAKKGERDSCRILAKEIVKADKQINKLYASKAHLNSVQMSMKHQLEAEALLKEYLFDDDNAALMAHVVDTLQSQISSIARTSTLRVAGALAKSTEVMQSMQQLVKVPEIQATMREMSKEMMKAGIIEEMLDDTMEAVDDEDLDEEADEEVDKVLYELTAGELGKAPAAVDDSLPVTETEGATAGPSRAPAAAVALEEDDDDLDDMKARLEALRS